MGKQQDSKIIAEANRLASTGMTLDEVAAAPSVKRSTTWLWRHGVRASQGAAAPEAVAAAMPTAVFDGSQAEQGLDAWRKNFQGDDEVPDDDVASLLPGLPHEPPQRRLSDSEVTAVVLGDYHSDEAQLAALQAVSEGNYAAMTDDDFAAALAKGDVDIDMLLNSPSPSARLLHQIALAPDLSNAALDRICWHPATHPHTIHDLTDRAINALKAAPDTTDVDRRRRQDSDCARVLNQVDERESLPPETEQLLDSGFEILAQRASGTKRLARQREEVEYAQLPVMTSAQFAEVMANQDDQDDQDEAATPDELTSIRRRATDVLRADLDREPTSEDWTNWSERTIRNIGRWNDGRFNDSQHEQLRQRLQQRIGLPLDQ